MTSGCLVIHGLTGTPATVASINTPLLEAGYRVATPCLAGHGGSLADLAASRWEEWYETVRIAYAQLRREVGRVFYAGISLGALLGLKLAIDEGWGVRGLALIGTPLALGPLERLAVPLVRHSPLKWLIRSVPKDFERSVRDPEGRHQYSAFSLPAIPTRAVFEIDDLARAVRADLGRVSNPLLLLHGRHDTVAPLANLDLVEGLVASDAVERRIFEDSAHVVTMDSEQGAAAQSIIDFFARFR